jgi:mono/diheme cytochrome c family protein
MWNHPSPVQRLRAADPRLDVRETGDLVAFLFMLDYWDGDGDAGAGGRLFIEKKCVICHQVAGTGGVAGPSLDRFKEYNSPMLVAAMMWNHGPQMAEAMRTRGIDRPTLETTELRDLIAYLKSESSASLAGPVYLLPGDASQGRRIFVEKRCSDCHSGSGSGRSLLGRGVRRNFTQFATAMWNKTSVMMTSSKRRGVVIPQLRADEMANLVAYLDSVGYFADSGNAKRGQNLALDKACVVCHSAHGLGAPIGREIIWPQGLEASTVVISFAWNHSLIVESAAGQAKAAWRPLGAEEMADLMAFVRSLNRERPERLRDGSATSEKFQAP